MDVDVLRINEHVEFCKGDIKVYRQGNLCCFMEMIRVIKFVLDTKLFYLKIESKIEAEYWTGNSENWININCFISYMLGVQICWRSKASEASNFQK